MGDCLYLKRLLELPSYQLLLKRLEEQEKDRIYCRHDRYHFQKVEEIGRWICKKNGLLREEELIGPAAWLHDIGRVDQNEGTLPHADASVQYARVLLPQIGCPLDKTEEICQAISGHSSRQNARELWNHLRELHTLQELLSAADQLSRSCYCCLAERTCKWKETEKIFCIKEEAGEDVYWQQGI